jgi:uncharacterized protein YaeQ
MALGATIFKINLNLCNFNTHYYEDYNLTVAKHPSENESRMMYRLLAFLYCAHNDLEFTKGLSTPEVPELWQKDYSGDIVHWIELGTPDEKRIRQACGKSKNVSVFTYHHEPSLEWYEKIKGKLIQNSKVKIYHFKISENGPIEKIVEKSMRLSCTIEDNIMHLGNDNERVSIEVICAQK